MEKIEEVVIPVKRDTPEVQRNKELMKNFDHGGAVYQKGMKELNSLWKIEGERLKAGLQPPSIGRPFVDRAEGISLGTDAATLNKMYQDMTYEKALDLLQSYHEMMTDKKNNQQGLKFLNSLPGNLGGWAVDLALLRLEQYNHEHQALAGRVALAVVDENKKASPKPKKQTKVKSVLTKSVAAQQIQEQVKERKRVTLE
ncbi:MAG: hypothetical protein ACI4OR_02275 [Alphaproteobacteria bacterium]